MPHEDTITLPRSAVVGLAAALAAFPWDDNDADIDSGELIGALTQDWATVTFLAAVRDAGVPLDDTWERAAAE